MRKNVWLFDFRMTVYYQAHSSGEINRHHTQVSKYYEGHANYSFMKYMTRNAFVKAL